MDNLSLSYVKQYILFLKTNDTINNKLVGTYSY